VLVGCVWGWGCGTRSEDAPGAALANGCGASNVVLDRDGRIATRTLSQALRVMTNTFVQLPVDTYGDRLRRVIIALWRALSVRSAGARTLMPDEAT